MAGTYLPSLDYAAIAELVRHDQWVCWKTVIRTSKEGDEKPTKVPINPKTGKKALVNVEHSWGSFRTACQRYVQADDLGGVGFVITAGGEYTGIDLDHCRNPTTGVIEPEALQIIQMLDSYAEASPSGTGVHIWVKGKPPGRSRKSARGEIYSQDRYLTVTGEHIPGTPETINFREAQLHKVYYLLFEKARRAPATDLTPATVMNDPRFAKLIDDLNAFCAGDAVAPAKIGILFENNHEAERLWQRQRKKPAEETWSQSEWDLALANHFLDADWLPVEVMRALIENRRKHGVDMKLRPDYYARTLVAAQRGRERGEALKNLAKVGELPQEQRIKATLENLSATFGFTLKRLVKFVGDPPSYRIVTDKGASTGDIRMLSSQTAFRNAVMEACGHVIPTLKAAKWMEAVQAILNAIEEDYAGDEMTDRGQMNAWLEAYLDDRPKAVAQINGHAIAQSLVAAHVGNPFIVDENLRIVGPDFIKFLRRTMGVYVSGKKIGTMMRDVGANPMVFAYTAPEGRRTSRSVWQLPRSFYWSIMERRDDEGTTDGAAADGEKAPIEQPPEHA